MKLIKQIKQWPHNRSHSHTHTQSPRHTHVFATKKAESPGKECAKDTGSMCGLRFYVISKIKMHETVETANKKNISWVFKKNVSNNLQRRQMGKKSIGRNRFA